MKNINAIAIVVVSLAGYNLWPYMGKGYTLPITLLLCAVALVLKSERHTAERRIYYVFAFFAFNNLMDELFFNPRAFEINEYFVAGLIVCHQIYLHQCHKMKNQ